MFFPHHIFHKKFFCPHSGYILFRMSYNIVMTIASFELATNIPSHSNGLVFGFNLFLAVGLQSLLAIAVSSGVGFALEIQDQYIVYACWYWVAGTGYVLACYIVPEIMKRSG